jgi:hypothetical protein
MKSPFSIVASLIFAVIAVVHVYRLISPFAIQIGSLAVPQSASWLGLIVAGGLSFWGFRSRA